MKYFAFRMAIVAAGLMMWAATTHAAPLTWYLPDIVLVDPYDSELPAVGLATGSFVYDADTGVYSDINITVTTTSSQTPPSVSYTYLIPPDSASTAVFLNITNKLPLVQDFNNNYGMYLTFAEPLTNSGGTVEVLPFALGGSSPNGYILMDENDPDVFSGIGVIQEVAQGSYVTTIPEPATALMTMVAGGAVLLRRRPKHGPPGAKGSRPAR